MYTGDVEAKRYLSGVWSHAVLAEKKLIKLTISPADIRAIADALDEEGKKDGRDARYCPGVVLEDESKGSFVVGKIPADVGERPAYTTEPYWGDVTLYVSAERLRIIADRLENQPKTLALENRAQYRIKEIAEIIGGLVVIFYWDF